MGRYKSNILEDFFSQLRFAPDNQQRKQLAAARQLLAVIEPEREYPFDFIVFRITGHRPKTEISDKIIAADQLADDLRVFIRDLDKKLLDAAWQQNEEVYTVSRLARKLSVSTKTINRWRRKGLAGRIYMFEDGVQRVGFPASAIESFVRANPELVKNAGRFARLEPAQKKQITELACNIAGAAPALSRHKVMKEIAARTGRAVETIRRILIQYENDNTNKQIFSKPAGVVSPQEAGAIHKLFKQDTTIAELMTRFRRSRSSIYRIINKHIASQMAGRKINYIDSGEFLEDNARQNILSAGRQDVLRQYKTGALLTSQQERELFRRYNYLKYLACLSQTKLDRINPRSSELKRIEKYLADADRLKKIIIEANLRLVVSIAARHAPGTASIADIISDGNISLMRAVENFDYTRGYRFSTYASWAITKDFARKIPAEAARPDRHTASDMSAMETDRRIDGMVDFAAVESAHRNLVAVIENNLNRREQFVISNHFALEEGPVKKKPMTLKQIGEQLGVSAERVRQIELAALQKLRHVLSDEEFDLLTG